MNDVLDYNEIKHKIENEKCLKHNQHSTVIKNTKGF